ncbi:hypothetical protein [Streptomyces sp. NPDC057616]|uniref:hypothetical protein n=1 Tax=Streptomyces sp. NPDC057616 TaxID=3346183 RepID=UPI003684C559
MTDTTPREEQRPSTAREAALPAEVDELRAGGERWERWQASRAVIDQARGMVMALAPCTSERAWDLPVDMTRRLHHQAQGRGRSLVATTKDYALPAPPRQELRQALRRLTSADRR